jgi:hypothetical protein
MPLNHENFKVFSVIITQYVYFQLSLFTTFLQYYN